MATDTMVNHTIHLLMGASWWRVYPQIHSPLARAPLIRIARCNLKVPGENPGRERRSLPGKDA